MNTLLIIPFVISFFTCLILIPFWINRAKKAGLVGKDMHKIKHPPVAENGGLCVVLAFTFGMLVYVFIETFYFKNKTLQLQIMTVLSSILIASFIGFVDGILGWKIGLRQWQKPILTILVALPIMVVNSGQSIMFLPFFGVVNFGLIYPLIIIPLIIIVTSNSFNLLAGYNGLEGGMGIIILGALGLMAYVTGVGWVALIALSMITALIAFLFYNWNPAKVFPGDIMTYSVGALIGVVAIMGNMEKAALVLLLPYIAEFFLKLRGKLRKESFAKLEKDGSLSMPYEKMYGLEHGMIDLLKKIKNKVYETDVVEALLVLEIFLVSIVFLLK